MVYVSPLIARGLNRLQLLPVFRIGYTVRILNQVFKIPVIENKEGFIYHQVVGEHFLISVFQKLYEVKNFTFLDAGVNFGQTLLKIKAVSPDAEYIGFEPSGLCSYYTSHLIKVNRIAHAKLIRCALSDSPGVLTLHAGSEGDTRATIMEDSIHFNEGSFEELVPAVTLDSLIAVITAAGKDIILKIDVEGAEWLVLQGAGQFIGEYRPVVIFENLPFQNEPLKEQQQLTISHFFSKQHYNVYAIDEENRTLLKTDIISNSQNHAKTNYLAVPAEKTSLFNMLA